MSESTSTNTREVEPDERDDIERVTTLELFLDLVFVFTVTQLTELVSGHHAGGGYLKAGLILVVTWWMYDGYVWLTGNVAFNRPDRRLVLFVGMGGFLMMAIAIPGAFGATEEALSDSGVVFGCAYLVVTLVHAGLFSTAPNLSAKAILRIAPFNLAGATVLIAAGFVAEDWRWIGWVIGIVVMLGSSLFGRTRGFSVSAAHFAERHGLVIIIALGESIVDIGLSASGLRIDGQLVVAAMLGLTLSATMWWVYFDRDDQLAESTLTAEEGDRRSRMGLWLAYTHLVMIAGIVVMSAGVKLVVAHPGSHAATADAWNLAAGVAIYLLGEAWFGVALGTRGGWRTVVAAVVVLAGVPLGTHVSGLAQLGASVVVMVVLIVADRVTRRAPE
jgi:low temperature requirement protein LtrA